MTDTKSPKVDKELARYLVSGERVVAVVREHWVSLSKPVAAFIAALFVATYVEAEAPRSQSGAVAANFFWYVSLAAGLYLLWRVLNWWHDWFAVTDKRFLKFYGFITRKVAMMPMGRVTDMTFHRSIMGRLLGYGTFILESAGQDQALSRIDFVPNAETHYRAICAVLFGSDEPDPRGPHWIGDDATGSTWDNETWEDPGGENPDYPAQSSADPSRRAGSEPSAPHLLGPNSAKERTWSRNSGRDRDLDDTGEIPVVHARPGTR